jgi:hypothetical protein
LVAVKLGSTPTTGGGFGVDEEVSPPLLQPKKPTLKTKIKMQNLISIFLNSQIKDNNFYQYVN